MPNFCITVIHIMLMKETLFISPLKPDTALYGMVSLIEWYFIDFDFFSKFSFYDYRFQIVKNFPPEIFDKMYVAHTSSPMRAISLFYELLSELYEKMELTTGTKPHFMIEPAVKYIETNYNKPISINELSSLCRISRSALFKHFKNNFGVSPVEYKHNIMIQHAIDLLSNTELSIEEISLKVGFVSSNYFRKVFASLTDKTPKELRKK